MHLPRTAVLLSSDPQFAFYLEEVLALANNEGAPTGEVLRIATSMIPHDFESAYNSFYPMAQGIYAQAESGMASNDRVSAREAYLRAASYYRGADFFLIGNWSDPRVDPLWVQQLDAFEKAVALMEVRVEDFTLKAHSPNMPGGEFKVIGRFYRAANAIGRTPTIVVGNGYDGSQEESYHTIGLEILKHEYNFVTYGGPGQPTVRRQQKIGFIPDWYNVATPVVEYLSKRSDVDMSRLPLIGLSFGGTLAPIAASREHPFTKVVAIDGLVSIQQGSKEEWPKPIIELYNNEWLRQRNSTYPSSLRWFIDQGLYSFNTTNPYEWFSRLGNITMSPEVVKTMPRPVFVAKGQDDTMSLNQPELAYEILVSGRPNGKNLTYFHEFNTSLGAGEHVAIGAMKIQTSTPPLTRVKSY
ncbi:hypothetical protein M409DRAFT_61863 [Zasmidium cellare ATCC 36951]|uniref:AB hydrolase-1 domain-containing protein n=1 Tax=Zasmidium cellare ATCC 36951 TaxID=1080233 RepID=A0A6A6D5H4_ZASCE|nr:uncharacterized protein M409DRAFT_61863 [Zasmidium cellare ATCC 36951]KAF2173472.1 hypothetical protein M409DRAFT_61863 [Zasmidium cellare ATCC 36951]